jgi:glycosyltransferase involved in cell wall biosynthesis
MKIAHLIFSFNIGGAETMLVDIANEQSNHEEVSVIIINKILNKNLISKIDKRISVYLINRDEGSKNPIPIIKLNKLLIKMEADVLHCHNHNIISLIIPILRKRAMLTVHDVNIPGYNLKKYARLYAISKRVQEDIKFNSGLSAFLVYNGVDIKKIEQKKVNSSNRTFRLIIISRLQHLKKGQHIVIEAINILRNRGVDGIKLDIIGEGESDFFLKKLVSEYGLIPYVNFLGLRDRTYIYQNINKYDLLIQPSFYEGFGLTVTEGMAAKVPVLVSDVDGPMEIIENGKFGYFFKSGNTEDLANKISIILENINSEIHRTKIESAYSRVITTFDIKKTAMNYIANYL